MTDIRTESNAMEMIAISSAAEKNRRRNVRFRNIGIGFAGFLTLILVWKLSVNLLNVPSYILPAPEQVVVGAAAQSWW